MFGATFWFFSCYFLDTFSGRVCLKLRFGMMKNENNKNNEKNKNSAAGKKLVECPENTEGMINLKTKMKKTFKIT